MNMYHDNYVTYSRAEVERVSGISVSYTHLDVYKRQAVYQYRQTQGTEESKSNT